ncbi:tetrathionate reductase subunit C [Vibrio ishigakensis]|uniref:Tetrathionate reductase subunit C n=1 Tax=Vibrio ishigakensis TaxID=1481914 RepID=A0A0B8QDN5_9VIBR|nr:tetrathionate reductase subunit C [Vibrio ishigakensis]
MNEHGVALWNSPLTVVLTSLSGVAVGALLFNVLSHDGSTIRSNILRTLLVTNIAFLFLANWWAIRFSGAEVQLSKAFWIRILLALSGQPSAASCWRWRSC